MIVNKTFLKSKICNYISGWNGKHESLATSGRGNINILTDNVISFEEYNLLPVNDSKLDGHYTIYVNYKTFKYTLYKHGSYGSLTYFFDENGNMLNDLNDQTIKIIESIIADKLLGAYYYNDKHVNHKGKNLIKNSNSKYSLLTDYRGYVWSDLKPNNKSDKDIEACKLLDDNYT